LYRYLKRKKFRQVEIHILFIFDENAMGSKKMLEGISAKGVSQEVTPSCEVPENRIR
jgi:hypothetical protein